MQMVREEVSALGSRSAAPYSKRIGQRVCRWYRCIGGMRLGMGRYSGGRESDIRTGEGNIERCQLGLGGTTGASTQPTARELNLLDDMRCARLDQILQSKDLLFR